MKRILCAFLMTVYLYGADYNFGGTSDERHKEMVEHLTPEPPPLSWWDRPYLTGDWNGGRSKLARDGVTIGMSYVADILGNPIGGRAKGVAFAGSFGLDINVDIGKYTALKGLSFYTSVVGRTGTNLSAKKIGNQFPVAQVYGGQNIRLNEFYLKQVLCDEWILMKLGRLNGGNDFLQSELYYKFVNNGFDGNPIAIFFNGPFTAYPNATWGFLFQFRPYKRILAKLAAYVAQDDVADNKYHGLNWSLNGSDGTLLMTEWSYQVNQLKTDTGYPGNYRAGYYYFTDSKGEKFLGGHYHGNSGYYFLIDQMIFRQGDPKEERGLTPFVALLFAPKDRNLLPFFVSSGLVYKGLFPSRPKDYTNLGFIYGKYSTDMRQAQEIAKRTRMMPVPSFGNQPQNFEALIELNHWFQINPWFIIVPDVQYIINPRGLGTIKDALVIGAQISVTL
ncbi:MAG: carbohydrate porin [Chlamydiia bacterium]|nr:carbohydrate porin [Chlamydiia bacterium]